MTHRPHIAFASLFVSTLVMLLAGCSGSSYTVEVHNLTTRTISARLQPDRLSGAYDSLDAARIPPGGVDTLGPVTAGALTPVALVVELSGEVGSYPPRERLGKGEWIATVTSAPIDSWQAVKVDMVRREADEFEAAPIEESGEQR